MFTAVTIFTILASILLVLVVLVQSSKGGGLAAGFSSGTQLMGVRKTTDLLEKLTWGLALSIFVLSVAGAFFLPRAQPGVERSAIQEQYEQATVPAPPPAQFPAGEQAQPAPAPTDAGGQ
jgi:preprotein translocase subunit SecG